MKIFVVIVTYNGSEWIERCLNSVYNSSIEATPIVIDNQSSDNTLSIIERLYPECKLICTGKNLGFGKANNIGIQWASEQGADYIYLLNQDAWLEPDTLDTLVKIHSKNPEYIILSPIQLSADGTSVDKSFYQNTLGQGRCLNLYNDYLCGSIKEVYPTTFVMAAHWLLYVPYLKKVGLFSPVFPHYGEDTNFVHRSRWFNYKIGICPNTKAYHDRQYRIEPPAKWLHKEKTSLLAVLNNPMLVTSDRLERYIRFVIRVMRHGGVTFIDKVNAIYHSLKMFSISKNYRSIYKTENCFEKFRIQYEDN